MPKFIAERHLIKEGTIVKPGEEIEFTKAQAKGHLDAGWISEKSEPVKKVAPKDVIVPDAEPEQTNENDGDDSDK